VLRALWSDAERRLTEATLYDTAFREAQANDWVSKGIVSYRGPRRPGGLDGGEYRWMDGFPSITLFRVAGLPARHEDPDVMTAPTQDACLLAHELGHFISDKEGTTTEEARDRWARGERLSSDDVDLILTDEREAWRIAHQLLEQHSFSHWDVFNDLRSRWYGSYEVGLTAILSSRG
jgi:hypothetical protein